MQALLEAEGDQLWAQIEAQMASSEAEALPAQVPALLSSAPALVAALRLGPRQVNAATRCPEVAATSSLRAQALPAAVTSGQVEATRSQPPFASAPGSSHRAWLSAAEVNAAFDAGPDVHISGIISYDVPMQDMAASQQHDAASSQTNEPAASQEDSSFCQVKEARVSQVDGYCSVSLSSSVLSKDWF